MALENEKKVNEKQSEDEELQKIEAAKEAGEGEVSDDDASAAAGGKAGYSFTNRT